MTTREHNGRVFDESEVVEGIVLLANRGVVPRFMQALLRGRVLIPLHARPGSVVDRLTGLPVGPSITPEVVALGDNGMMQAIQKDLQDDLRLIVERRLSRVQEQRIATEADLVTVEMKGGQREKSPRFIRVPDRNGVPDLHAAVAYGLNLLVNDLYREQLARCKLDGCGNFFLRQLRQARPECYCSPAHASEGKGKAASNRARDYRARQKAIERLEKRFPTSARGLVGAIKASGLTADQLVQRAEAEAASRKPRKHK